MWYLDIALAAVMVVGLGVCVYALAIGVVDLIAKVRADKANNDLWQQMLLDDVYYRDAYADLFTGLLRTLEDQNPMVRCEELSELKNAVNQFIDDSKLVR